MLLRLAAVMAAICVLAPGAQAAMGSPEDGLVVAYRLPSDLSSSQIADYMWNQPPSISRFYYTKIYLQTDRHTDLRVAYDNNNLYLAYRTLFGNTGAPVSKGRHTQRAVLDDDCAVAILDTDSDPRTFLCFGVNSAGARYAEHVKQYIRKQWTGAWNAHAKVGTDNWTVFMTVPFRSLGVTTPKPGATWSVNFERGNPGGKAPSTWIKAVRRAWELESRGKLVFGDPNWPLVSIPAVRVEAPGRHDVKLSVFNPRSEPVTLVYGAMVDGTALEPNSLVAAPGASEIEVGLDFPFDGWSYLNLRVTDADGQPMAVTSPIPVRMPDYWSRIERCKMMITDLEPLSESGRAQKAALVESLRDLTAQARSALGDKAKWTALKPKVEEAEKSVGHLRCVSADKENRGYAVGTETALRKIMRDQIFEGEFDQPAIVGLAKNEFESVQIAVLAHERDLQGVVVSVSGLKGPNGASIPSDKIGLNLVDFVKTGDPPYEIRYMGWYPDPLMPNAAFDLKKGGIRPVWVTVRTSETQPAGQYTGTLTIAPANAPRTTVPLEVIVWDFAIPTKPHLKNAFAFEIGELRAWYGKPATREQRLEWYQFILDHRLNPTNIYSMEPVPSMEDIEFSVERGMNAFCLHNYGRGRTEAKRAEVAQMIREYETYLKAKGWWDLAYIYGFDELGSDLFESLRTAYGEVKTQFPDLPRMTTIVPCEELKGSVDIWVPLTGNYDPEWCNKFVEDGDEVWWYVCCHPVHPYPNYFVDYPAIDPRILSWMNWKYQVPGILYYMINLWGSNRLVEGQGIRPHNDPEERKAIAAGKRWPEVSWNTHTCAGFNGDGHLVYPGPGMKPISSIRLVSIRDGIDDYDYFHILDTRMKEHLAKNGPSELTQKAKELLAVRDDVVMSTTEYTLDPVLLLEARQEVAEMIVKLGGS